MNKLMIFEGNQVEIITNEKGEPLFEVYSTGMALGYMTNSKGKTYPHKVRIDNTIKNAEISTVVHGVQQYFTEDVKKLNNYDAQLFGIKNAGRKGELLINEYALYDLL